MRRIPHLLNASFKGGSHLALAATILASLTPGSRLCEGADCNNNCIEDGEEIRDFSPRDCNQNGILDQCELQPSNAKFVAGPDLMPGGLPASIRVADLDSDGRADVVTGDSDESAGTGVSLYFSAGGGAFESPLSELIPRAIPQTLVVADLDADRDLDIAIAVLAPNTTCQGSDRVAVLENRGGRAFAEPSVFETGSVGTYMQTSHLLASDADGDGDLDLVIGERRLFQEFRDTIRILSNRGDASFEPLVHFETGSRLFWGMATADFDGDSDVDIAVVHRSDTDSLRVFKNRGTGSFDAPVTIEGDYDLAAVAAGDLDGDGDVDIAVTTSDSLLVVYRNSGGGSSWERAVIQGVDASFTTTADLDGDGLRELVATGGEGLEVVRFREWPSAKSGRYLLSGSAIGLGDMDGDLDDDVVVGTREALSVIRSDGGDLAAPLQVPAGVRALAAADLDGDGDLDLVATQRAAAACIILWNDGSGGFSSADSHRMPQREVRSAAVGDLDADGDRDLVTFSTAGIEISWNPGDGKFFETHLVLPVVIPSQTSLALADLDGDADLDVAALPFQFQVTLFFNQGDGAMLVGEALAAGAGPAVLAAADLDADGRGDLITGNTGEPDFPSISILMSRGGGAFSPARNYGVRTPPIWIAPGDIDADGDIDLVTNGIVTLENNGDGTLGEERRLFDADVCAGVMADLDGDRDLDLATSERVLLLNRGGGSFDGHEWFSLEGRCQFIAADLDGDRNVDLIQSNLNVAVTWNRGGAHLVSPGNTETPGPAFFAEIADLEGNGDPEITVVGRSHVGFLDPRGRDTARVRWELVASRQDLEVLASADLDLDGSMDLAFISKDCSELTCSRRLTTRLHRAGGDPVAEVLDLETSLLQRSMKAADVDGDGDIDLVGIRACNDGCGSEVFFYPNDGDGRFSARHIRGQDNFASSVEPVDIDGDGDLDLVTDAVAILKNRGGGTFDAPHRIAGGCCGLAAGDLDGDGDTDLVSSAAFLKRTGDALAFEEIRHQADFDRIGGPEDIDGDGFADVVAFGRDARSAVRVTVLLGDGTGKLDAAAWIRSSNELVVPVFFETRDLDSDGRPEIVLGDREVLQVLWNRAEGPFARPDALDLDSDGIIDDSCQPVRFTRGDVTGEGTIDMADPITILLHLFQGSPEPECMESANANDDTAIDLTDALHLLLYLFQGGPPPSTPDSCGRDYDSDTIGCSAYPAC